MRALNHATFQQRGECSPAMLTALAGNARKATGSAFTSGVYEQADRQPVYGLVDAVLAL
jgi:hypothetical protein